MDVTQFLMHFILLRSNLFDASRMEGIKNVTQYSTGFIEYHLIPASTGHLLFIVLYSIFSIYFYRYLFQYPIFKWIYLGSIVIFISTIYHDGITIGTPPNFKLEQ